MADKPDVTGYQMLGKWRNDAPKYGLLGTFAQRV
jgi:hypothetical protein